jgi:putative intracellular protease/amidase
MSFYNFLKIQIKNEVIKTALLAICILFSCSTWSKDNTNSTAPITDKNLISKKILFVLSSDHHGYFMSEVVEPYQLLQNAGFDIDISSPKGGQGKQSGMTRLNHKQVQWLDQSTLKEQLKQSIPLKDINADDYAAIYFAGGSGPMFDLVNNNVAQQITRRIYQNGGLVAADCHGPVALVNVKLSNGKLLLSGKKVTGKANTEEGRWARSNYPFLLEDKLTEVGALYNKGPNSQPYVVTDGRLITAQNPASAILMTEKMIERLRKS